MPICVPLLLVFWAGVTWPGIGLAQNAPVFYSYQGDSGRTVYVNRFSMVPPEKRAQARAVDLSEVELHEELADDLADAVEDELRYLKDSDPCNEARSEERAGAWKHIWRRHGPWILASLAAIILVMMTPWMVARTPPGVWSRLLMVALPALAMTGLLAVSATRARDSFEAVEELVRLCDANEKEASPRKQVLRLNEMYGYIQKLYRDQYEEIERMSEIK
jgi:muconolactone delta-isomerase